MQAATLVSVEEYLSSSYEPDCDYVDGVLEERNLGEQDHSRFQMLVAGYLFAREKEWQIRVLPEQRVQTRPTRFRVPDVTVVAIDNRDQIIRKPPLLCIEVLSPEDRMSRVMVRVHEYLELGVPDVWIIDPNTRQSFTCTKVAGLRESTSGILTASDGRITLNVAELGD